MSERLPAPQLGENIPENIRLNIREFWNWVTADEPELDGSLAWTLDPQYVKKDLDREGAAIVWVPKDISGVMKKLANGESVSLDLKEDYAPVYEADFYIGILSLNVNQLRRKRFLEEAKLKPLKDYIDKTLEMTKSQGAESTATREQFASLMKKKRAKLDYITEQFGTNPSHLKGLARARYDGEMNVLASIEKQINEIPGSNLKKMDWYENEDDMEADVMTTVDVPYRLGLAEERYKSKSKILDEIDDSIKDSQKFIAYWEDYKAATLKDD